MIELESLSSELAERTHHRAEDWHRSLNTAIHDPSFSLMSDGEILALAEALKSPEQLQWLTKLFREEYRHDESSMPYDVLADAVATSERSLAEWLDALHQYSEAGGAAERLSSQIDGVLKGPLAL